MFERENLNSILKVLGIAWSLLVLIGAGAFYFGGEWSTWEKVKRQHEADNVHDFESPIESLKSRVQKLEKRPGLNGITSSTRDSTILQGNLEVSENRWDGESQLKHTHTSMVQCPDGQYVVGMRGIDEDTGGYCTTCISNIEFICREL